MDFSQITSSAQRLQKDSSLLENLPIRLQDQLTFDLTEADCFQTEI